MSEMKNLNIYTFRELIKMYIDERPMPDVAFVTQTEAMKLQSMGKEMNNNSEWITDRKPMEEDADYGIPGYNRLVFATDSTGQVKICSCYHAAYHGFPWQPIMIPEPYVKQSRFEIYGAVGGWQVWGVRDNNGFDIIGFISRDHAKWAVEQLEKVMP